MEYPAVLNKWHAVWCRMQQGVGGCCMGVQRMEVKGVGPAGLHLSLSYFLISLAPLSSLYQQPHKVDIHDLTQPLQACLMLHVMEIAYRTEV